MDLEREHMWDNWTKEEHLKFMNYANKCCNYNFKKILNAWSKWIRNERDVL